MREPFLHMRTSALFTISQSKAVFMQAKNARSDLGVGCGLDQTCLRVKIFVAFADTCFLRDVNSVTSKYNSLTFTSARHFDLDLRCARAAAMIT